MIEEKKKCGRPAISPEERERRLKERKATHSKYAKEKNYKDQKKWRENNPDYEKSRIKVTLPPDIRDKLETLAKERKVSIASLITDAVTEKYGNNT